MCTCVCVYVYMYVATLVHTYVHVYHLITPFLSAFAFYGLAYLVYCLTHVFEKKDEKLVFWCDGNF